MSHRQKIIDGKKECTKCHQLKFIEEFSRSTKTNSGFGGQCKECKNSYQRQLFGNSEVRRKRRSYQSTKYMQKRKYGLSPEDVAILIQSQNSCCAICNIYLDRSEAIKVPHIDHCHTKGHVRGILCSRCNAGLGSFRDNIDFLLSAITYLQEKG